MLNSKFWVSQTTSGEQAWRHANLPSLERKLLNLCRHSASLGDLYAQFNNLNDLESTVSILLQKGFIRLSAFRPGQGASSPPVLPDADDSGASQSRQEISHLLSRLKKTTQTTHTSNSGASSLTAVAPPNPESPSSTPEPFLSSWGQAMAPGDDPMPGFPREPDEPTRSSPVVNITPPVPADLDDFIHQLNDSGGEEESSIVPAFSPPLRAPRRGSPAVDLEAPSQATMAASTPNEETLPSNRRAEKSRSRRGLPTFDQFFGLGASYEATSEGPSEDAPNRHRPLSAHRKLSKPLHPVQSPPAIDPFSPPDLFPPLDSVTIDFNEDEADDYDNSPAVSEEQVALGLQQLSQTILGGGHDDADNNSSPVPPPAPAHAPPDHPALPLVSPPAEETEGQHADSNQPLEPAFRPAPRSANPVGSGLTASTTGFLARDFNSSSDSEDSEVIPARDPLFVPAIEERPRSSSSSAHQKFSKLGQSIGQIQSLQAQRRAAKAKGKIFLEQKQQARAQKIASMASPEVRQKNAEAHRKQEAQSFKHMADVLKGLNKNEK